MLQESYAKSKNLKIHEDFRNSLSTLKKNGCGSALLDKWAHFPGLKQCNAMISWGEGILGIKTIIT